MLNACLMSGKGAYNEIEDNLNLYVGRFNFEREIRPFMIRYRAWSLYVIDTEGMSPYHELQNLTELGRVIRAHPTRIIVVWSHHTWEALKNVDPDAAYAKNCLFCDDSDWCQKLVKALKIYEGRRRGKR